MLRVLPALLLLAFTVYTLVDVVQTDDADVKGLPKIVWVLVVLLFSPVGGIAWLVAGRERGPAGSAPGNRPGGGSGRLGGTGKGNRQQGPRGPDDDPDFLRNL